MDVSRPGEEIIPMHDYGTGHWTRTLLFDRGHKKLYVTIGSRSNIDLNEPPARAALNRYNPDGSGHEIVATGLRNIIGLRWRPGSDDLWAAVQERDGLGDDLVSDYLVQIKEGGFYGWPYAYSGPYEEPRHKDVAPDMVKNPSTPMCCWGRTWRCSTFFSTPASSSRPVPGRSLPRFSRLVESLEASGLQDCLYPVQGRQADIGSTGLLDRMEHQSGRPARLGPARRTVADAGWLDTRIRRRRPQAVAGLLRGVERAALCRLRLKD